MIYIAAITDPREVIFSGAVTHGPVDRRVLVSADLADVESWYEFGLLPSKLREWEALQWNARDALDRVEPFTTSGSERQVLDFGSGWGFFLAIAKERGWTPVGLEPLAASAVYARATFGLDIRADTLHDDTFAPAFFDLITAFQVFEHLPHPAEDLARLHRSLRPGGVILIEVPNIATWSVRLLRSRHRHFVPGHLNFFSEDTLSAFLRRGGFDVLQRYHPLRRMTVRHLVSHWGGRYLPRHVTCLVERGSQVTGLSDRVIGLNVGDIVAVVARKAS